MTLKEQIQEIQQKHPEGQYEPRMFIQKVTNKYVYVLNTWHGTKTQRYTLDEFANMLRYSAGLDVFDQTDNIVYMDSLFKDWVFYPAGQGVAVSFRHKANGYAFFSQPNFEGESNTGFEYQGDYDDIYEVFEHPFSWDLTATDKENMDNFAQAFREILERDDVKKLLDIDTYKVKVEVKLTCRLPKSYNLSLELDKIDYEFTGMHALTIVDSEIQNYEILN